MPLQSVRPPETRSERTSTLDGFNREGRGGGSIAQLNQTWRVQPSQDSMSPDRQELLFASVELINDGFSLALAADGR